MPAEQAWRSRSPEEAARFRVLRLGDGHQALSFRFDGWEFGRPQSVDDFVDVHLWASGEIEWEAIFPGAVEASELLSLAGLLLDAARGLPDVEYAPFIDPRFTLSAWGVADQVRFLQLDSPGTSAVVAGTPSSVTIEVAPEQLLAAAVWLVDEAARFLPGDWISRVPWIPADPAKRSGEVLASARAAQVDSEPKTVDEAFSHLRELTEQALADPTVSDRERATMEFLARSVAEHEASRGSSDDEDSER
jgi:hypothetical protein